MSHERDPTHISTFSHMLDAARHGDEVASSGLFELVYGEMRSIARGVFGSGASGETLQPTALVHEAWLKMAGRLDNVEGKRHFLAIAATAMRQILHDHARAAGRQKRGGANRTVTLHYEPPDPTSLDASSSFAIDAVMLDAALTTLATVDARAGRVAELRVLGSMTIPEIALTLDVSRRTVDSDWSFARAWLHRHLFDE